MRDGRVIAGDSSITLREVARAWYLQPQTLPPDVDTGGLDVTAGYRAARDSGTFTYATHAAVVAVDPATGSSKSWTTWWSKTAARWSIRWSSTARSAAAPRKASAPASTRRSPFDAQASRWRRHCSTIAAGRTEMPNIRVVHMQTPSPYTEFGIKGMGEGGAVGPPAAIVSAVNDALPLRAEVQTCR